MAVEHSVDLVLVRHGLTLWNVHKRYLGQTDMGVLDEQLEPMKGIGAWLSDIHFNRVYSSDLKRCIETFDYLQKCGLEGNGSLDITSKSGPDRLSSRMGIACLDPRLRELDFGKWEGCTYRQLKNDESYRRWISNPRDISPPDGEAFPHFEQRVGSFLAELLRSSITEASTNERKLNHSHHHILVVTHGGVIRHMMTQLIPGRSFWEWAVDPGQAYQLHIHHQEGEWRCCSWQEVPTPENEK